MSALPRVFCLSLVLMAAAQGRAQPLYPLTLR